MKKGDYVIVRSRDAGVHAGELVSHSSGEVTLTKSRRLWYWVCAKGDFLSGVARHGLTEQSKVGGEIDVTVVGACEIIQCTPVGAASIRSAPEHRG